MHSRSSLPSERQPIDFYQGPALTRRELLRLSSVLAASTTLATVVGSLADFLPGKAMPTPTPRSTLTPRPAPTAARQLATSKPNVVLIIVDALRADHVSANGYSRSTTPNLTTWIANQGVTFHDAVTTAPWTFPANAAMMTGYQPAALGVPWFGPHSTLPTYVPTLAERLHGVGYYTAAFVSAPYFGSGWGFARGFDHFDESVVQAHPHTQDSGLAQEIRAAAVQWLNTWTPNGQPLFMLLYFFDPHSWYNPPSPYDQLYDPAYAGTLALPQNFRDGQDVVAGLTTLAPEDVQHVLALYDGEITYWDDQLGESLTALQSSNILNNALIVISADHGDMFGEHGKWNHTNCLYEEVLQVPLLMRYSGVITPGQMIDTPVCNMDLMPTILDYAGIPIPGNLQAVSLRPLIEGSVFEAHDMFGEMDGVPDPSHPFYWIAPHHDLRSIRRGQWKYIEHVRHPEADELYLLNSQTPYETDNLIVNEPARAQELRQAIQNAFPRRQLLPYIAY